MSTSDHPTDDARHRLHHSPDAEGEFEDKDVGATRADPPVGEFEDTDVVEPQPGVPEDEGSFADHDVASEHRHPVAEGSFEDAEFPGVDEDVEAVQVERALEKHDPVDGIDTSPPGSADPPTDRT